MADLGGRPLPRLAVFIQVDPDDHRYFSYENGEFFYPLGINLRSPD